MPKLKTKKGISKRFRMTKRGRIKYVAGGKSHLLSGKKKARLRKLRRARTLLDKKKTRYLKRMLPYG